MIENEDNFSGNTSKHHDVQTEVFVDVTLRRVMQYTELLQSLAGDTVFLPRTQPNTIEIADDIAQIKVSANIEEIQNIDVPHVPENQLGTTSDSLTTSQDTSEKLHMYKNEHTEELQPWRAAVTLPELQEKICTCMNCPLGETRTKFVFGVGNPQANVMVIGEAPGADEDAQGEPFVGAAGQLLNKILAAVNFKREEVFIANILKCRPPGNRRPTAEEVEQCEPYLQRQIEIIRPKFILALGLTAVDTLLKKKHKMGEIRGKLLEYHGATMIATYHPAALLRNPEWKRGTWEDVQFLRKLYDEYKQQENIQI